MFVAGALVVGGSLVEGVPGVLSLVVFDHGDGRGEDSEAEKSQKGLDSHVDMLKIYLVD